MVNAGSPRTSGDRMLKGTVGECRSQKILAE
jgi:hypothetical protein